MSIPVTVESNHDDCVFCDFADESVIIDQDDVCYTVISLDPVNKHHVLIIPRGHFENFIDVPDEILTHVFLVAKRMSKAVREAVKPISVHHVSNDDLVGDYNKVGHYKFHVIPRFPENGVMMTAKRERASLEQRAIYADEVRAALNVSAEPAD